MAGIFGFFDFTKEGPGIDPDEPEKGPVATFFSIVGTKFWKLITINLMMVLFHLPGILLSFVVANWLVPMAFPQFSYESLVRMVGRLGLSFTEGVTAEAYASHLFISDIIIFTFVFIGFQFFVVGPAQTGFTYLMRNFARREPCFIWMDFKDTVKNNWKQGLAHSVISSLVLILMGIAYYYYGIMFRGSLPGMILRTVLVVCLFLFTIMQFYIYQLMITFELRLKDIYKNALLFTFVRLPSNFGVLLLCFFILFVIPFLIIWILPSAMATLIVLVLYVVFFLSFTLLLMNFQAHRAIHKHMLKPILDKKKAEEQAAIEAEDQALLDDEDEEEEEEEPEEDEEEEGSDHKQGVPSGAPA